MPSGIFPHKDTNLSIKLQRNLLGSIDIGDISGKIEETEQERKDHCAAIFAVYPRLEKDIKAFLHQQLMFSSMQAEDMEKVIFGRGTFNGMALLLDYWRSASKEYEANSKPEGDFDKHGVIGEL